MQPKHTEPEDTKSVWTVSTNWEYKLLIQSFALSGAERLLLLLFLFGWHWVWHPIYVALRENEKVRERASLYIPPSISASFSKKAKAYIGTLNL